MIYNELIKCYDNYMQLPDCKLAKFGYSNFEEVKALVLTLDNQGHILEKNVTVFNRITVPEQSKRSGSNPTPHMLSDFPKYFLGIDADKKAGTYIDKTIHVESSLKAHKKMFEGCTNPILQAVMRLQERAIKKELLWEGGFTKEDLSVKLTVFRMNDIPGYLHEQKDVLEYWEKGNAANLSARVNPATDKTCNGISLVSGEHSNQIIHIHNGISNINPQQNVTAISFNHTAFTSYGNKGGQNCPMTAEEAFKYVTMLNYFLRYDSPNMFKCGEDLTCVFWTSQPNIQLPTWMMQAAFGTKFNSDKDLTKDLTTFNLDLPDNVQEELSACDKDNVKDKNKVLKTFLLDLFRGKATTNISKEIESVTVYFLGLSYNSSRLDVQFMYEDSFGNFLSNSQKHFKALELINENVNANTIYPTLGNLGYATEKSLDLNKMSKKVKKGTWEILLYNILFGTPYSSTLAYNMLDRYKRELILVQSSSYAHYFLSIKSNYLRLCYLKGYLNQHIKNEKEIITMALNPENSNIGYLYGRLFAFFEKAQTDANNQTLVKKYFSTFSVCPTHSLADLTSNFNYNLDKSARKGNPTLYLRKGVETLMDRISMQDTPKLFSLADQAQFTLGYYQQKADIWRKQEEKVDPILTPNKASNDAPISTDQNGQNN